MIIWHRRVILLQEDDLVCATANRVAPFTAENCAIVLNWLCKKVLHFIKIMS